MKEKTMIQTDRRLTALYRFPNPGKPKLMLIHGNASSSAFFFPVIEKLAEHFDIAAPDLNGFGDTESSPVHSPTALHDWAEDIDALAEKLGFERFALLGWSLGGGVVMRYAINHPDKLTHLILLSPMSPYGFGGTRADGTPYDEKGWGSPGGFANPAFIEKLKEQDRGEDPMAARGVLEKSLFANGWPFDKAYQDLFVDELLKIRLGEDYYPGDYVPQAAFPYVLPGTRGISNALAPQYANVSAIAEISPKVPILWIRGDKDTLVSDQSYSDLATLGMLNIIPGYPGAEVFPPQPMVAQTRNVLEKYRENGGRFEEKVFENCAHASHLEKPDDFVEEMKAFIGV
ncbi:MAG: alpha/beta hydrolase [Bacillota bacterium]|nr:alpha/beta hydrolase [Bacillota bacterium]